MCTEHHHWHHDYVRLAWDSGFAFDLQKAKTNLDWSSVGIVDIEAIVRDRDVAAVEKHLSTVSNYCLEPDHSKILDPTFVKVFRLSQLSAQYLLFCKRYLDNTVVLLKKELAKYKEENVELKDYTEELKAEIVELKKKAKALKESFENGNGFKCPTCLKMFVTEEYLIAHVKRRHENTTLFQSETDKLQLEIKELKERLNTTEKFIQSDHQLKGESTPDNAKVIVEEKTARVDILLYKFDELKQFIERELSTLRNEKCDDRYERWLEIVFKQLDNSKKELQSEKYDDAHVLSTGDGNCGDNKVDNVTQTGQVVYKDSEVMTETLPDDVINSKPPALEVDIKKLQEDLYANTENQLGQIQDALEQKLTGGLEQIQTQISTFCEKFNSIEAERTFLVEEHKESAPPWENPILTSPTIVAVEPVLKDKSDKENDRPKAAPRTTKSLPVVKEKKSLGTKRSAPTLEGKPFVKSPVGGLASEVTNSSTTSDEEKTFFIPERPQRIEVKAPIRIIGDKDRQKNVEVETLYDKNVKNTTKIDESSDSHEDNPIETPVRPSTSTLGRRSISSLKQAGKDKHVLAGLRSELEEMLCLRLKEVGVSPTWNRLPKRSYVTAMGIIQHQAELTKKKYPNYLKIKQKLLKKVNATLKKNVHGSAHCKMLPVERKHKPRVPVQRSPLSSEKRMAYDTDDETSSNRTFVTAPKDLQGESTVQIVESKPSASLPSIKKKVLFDLETSSTISRDKPHTGEPRETRKPRKQDRIPTMTMVMTKARAEDALIDTIDMFRSTVRTERNEEDETTESITSSILDYTKALSSQNLERGDTLTKDETSDWEISDIY